MLFIYYGLGKGKTSALNGSAIRAFGAGKKVAIYRFLKNRESAEDKMLEKLGIPVKKCHPTSKFVFQMSDEERQEAKEKHLDFLKMIKDESKNLDVIILDEILDLTVENVNFISSQELRDFLIDILTQKDVFVSGHEESEEIFQVADLISLVKNERHYFDKGVKARKGIEF